MSISVPRGHTVAIVGESGSGKSTTARVVTGLLPPSKGRITFNGRELPRKFSMTALPGTQHIAEDTMGENDQVRVKVIIKRWRL